MNTRERFHEIMHFNTSVHSLRWEFGYWGETIDNWYSQGLPRKDYPVLEKTITTPTSSLYSKAWNCRGESTLPKGIAVVAGGLYWPTQGFPYDHDVRNHFKMDYTQRLVDVNLHFCPMFDIEVLDENEKRKTGKKAMVVVNEGLQSVSYTWNFTHASVPEVRIYSPFASPKTVKAGDPVEIEPDGLQILIEP